MGVDCTSGRKAWSLTVPNVNVALVVGDGEHPAASLDRVSILQKHRCFEGPLAIR